MSMLYQALLKAYCRGVTSHPADRQGPPTGQVLLVPEHCYGCDTVNKVWETGVPDMRQDGGLHLIVSWNEIVQ